MKAWILAPREDTTRPGALVIRRDGEKQPVTATLKLLDLLPAMTLTSQVWQVELTDHLEVGDWFVTGDKVTYLQKYDIMSVIHDVTRDVVDEFYFFDSNEGFKSAKDIHDYLDGVRSMEGVINNAVYGFYLSHDKETSENKRAKYNGWLESALKASTPNSLVADKPLTTTYKAGA